LDPILQINLPRLKSQLKRSDPVLQQYVSFEKKLKETRSRWRQLKKRLDQYTLEKVRCVLARVCVCLIFWLTLGASNQQQREARLRAECQQLQRRWQKLEEQHRAGEIPDIDPEAIAVLLRSYTAVMLSLC
jgi:phage shock protein A